MSISFSFLIRECSLVLVCACTCSRIYVCLFGRVILSYFDGNTKSEFTLMNSFRCFPIKYTVSILFPLNFQHFSSLIFLFLVLVCLWIYSLQMFSSLFLRRFRKYDVYIIYFYENFFLNLTVLCPSLLIFPEL